MGGQDGDTFTFTGTPWLPRGRQGNRRLHQHHQDLGTKVTIVGGEGADVVGTTNARFETGTSGFINGQKGSGSIFLDGTAGITVHGGSRLTPSAKPPTSTLASFQVTRVLTPSLMALVITPLKVVVVLTPLLLVLVLTL